MTVSKLNGVTWASLSKVNGIAKASISKVDGETTALTWLDAFNQTPNSFTALPTNYTARTVFLSGVLSNTGLTYCRVTFYAQDATNGLTIDKAYIQTQGAGDAYDFSAAPVQLLFDGGNAGFTIAAGASKVSDTATFTIPASTNIVISLHTSGASGVGGKSGLATGNRMYYKATADEAATVDVTGYSASTDGTVWPIGRIEVA